LNDALRKGISNETLELLTQLSQKDPAAAQAAASDVMNKLVRSKFLLEAQPDYQQIGTATNFLSRYTSGDYESQKSIFDDSQMRQLANNLVSFYLQQSERYGSYIVNPTNVVQIAEKLVPSSVEALKQKQRTNARNGDGFSVEYSKLMSTDASPETLVTEAKRLPLSYRNAVYQNAAARYAQRGELDRATALLNENLSDDSWDSALMSLRSQYASTLMYSGKFAEAEAMIDQLPEYSRSNSLLNLANAIYQSDPVKNKSYALAVLGKARSAISDQPENSTEFSNLMQIIAAYGNIAPDEAFRVFEPLIPQMNELTDAFATVNQFQGGGNMRQGEYLLSQGISFGYYYDLSIFRAFATNDFDRTMKLIDGFSRREVRLAMLIYLAENVSNQQNNVQNTPGVRSLSVISLNR
jgi:tetratricopeptide (TPR) repeat protein